MFKKLSRDRKDIKKIQLKLPKMKTKRSKMKNTPNKSNSRLHITEEKIMIFEDIAKTTFQ